MLGNVEDILDYHKKVMLPMMEEAVTDAKLSRRFLMKSRFIVFRAFFLSEQENISHKYGRYCINYTRASLIFDQHIQFFSLYQIKKGIPLRVDAMLIKPVQRITRFKSSVF